MMKDRIESLCATSKQIENLRSQSSILTPVIRNFPNSSSKESKNYLGDTTKAVICGRRCDYHATRSKRPKLPRFDNQVLVYVEQRKLDFNYGGTDAIRWELRLAKDFSPEMSVQELVLVDKNEFTLSSRGVDYPIITRGILPLGEVVFITNRVDE